MILKTYSRIFTTDTEATLRVLEKLVGRRPELRFPFLDMEVLTLGDFCLLGGPASSMAPFLGAVGPVIVEDIRATEALAVASGAEVVAAVQEVPTGWNLFTRDAAGVLVEWVQWTEEIWAKVRAAERDALEAVTTGAN